MLNSGGLCASIANLPEEQHEAARVCGEGRGHAAESGAGVAGWKDTTLICDSYLTTKKERAKAFSER
jgi:hypothetical protein